MSASVFLRWGLLLWPLLRKVGSQVIPSEVRCEIGREVVSLDCASSSECKRRTGKVIKWVDHYDVQHLVVASNREEVMLPAYNFRIDSTHVCGRAQLPDTALAASSLFWGEKTVKPWMHSLEKVMPVNRLLVLPLREFSYAAAQRSTNRGDVMCLLPVLAALRWPQLHITLWEEVPEYADMCRAVMEHHGVQESIDILSVKVQELLRLFTVTKFDSVILLGNERPLFETFVDAGGLNFLMSTVRVVYDMVKRGGLDHPNVGPAIRFIPSIASVKCAPVTAPFLRGVDMHFGFDLSAWNVPREIPIRFNLWELEAKLLAEPVEVMQLEFGTPRIHNVKEHVFVLNGTRIDAMACWPSYAEARTEVLQDFAMAPDTAQVVYLLRKRKKGLETLNIRINLTVLGGFHMHIPKLLDTVSPPQKNLKADIFHWCMLYDQQRGEAYYEAIRKAVRPGHVVLDVGAGSGLLSMMALREGASHSHAFESEMEHARLARRIIKKNGFADRITIHEQWSTKVGGFTELGMSSRADMLVTETLGGSGDGLGEQIVEIIRHARLSLLRPGAIVIPARMRVYGQLAELPRNSLDVFGVNLRAPFLEFQPQLPRRFPRHMMQSHELLSEPFVLADIDFMAENISLSEAKQVTVVASRKGFVHGVLTWFEVDLDEDGEIKISTKPGNQPPHFAQFREEHWRTVLLPIHFGKGALKKIMAPHKVESGSKISFTAQRERKRVIIEMASISSGRKSRLKEHNEL